MVVRIMEPESEGGIKSLGMPKSYGTPYAEFLKVDESISAVANRSLEGDWRNATNFKNITPVFRRKENLFLS